MATGWRAWGWDVRRGPRVTPCEADLLSHLPRPQRAVQLMVRAVRPGGHLVLEDVFFPGHICYPANAAFDRYLELYQAVAIATEGGDAAIGVRLLGMVDEHYGYALLRSALQQMSRQARRANLPRAYATR